MGGFEVTTNIAEYFINGISENVFGRDMLEVDLIDLGAIVEVVLHAGSGDKIIKLKVGIVLKLGIVIAFTKEGL